MSSLTIQMETVGQIIRVKREKLGLLLRQVAYSLDAEELLVQFMSEKIAYETADEDCASKVLKAAEQKVKHLKSNPVKN